MYFKAIILFLKCATSDCISATVPLMEMLFPKMVLAFLLSLNLCKVCLLSLSPCVGLSFSPCIWHYLPCTPPPTATSQIPPTRDDNIWLWKKVCGDWLGWDARPQLLQGKRGLKFKMSFAVFVLSVPSVYSHQLTWTADTAICKWKKLPPPWQHKHIFLHHCKAYCIWVVMKVNTFCLCDRKSNLIGRAVSQARDRL